MITKNNYLNIEPDFSAGETILIDKEMGMTSFDVVYKIRQAVHVKKVGHAGTLDPAATGLLIVCTGKQTKKIYKFQELEKTYTGTITLGKRTASMDAETEAFEKHDTSKITLEEIEAVRDSFMGIQMQTPPMYSAVKHKGKPLYKYARKGLEVKRKPREINITGFDILDYNEPDIIFRISCSKGTYIRAIADDFGTRLGTGAFLSKLRRTHIGGNCADDALLIDEFRNSFSMLRAAELSNADRLSGR